MQIYPLEIYLGKLYIYLIRIFLYFVFITTTGHKVLSPVAGLKNLRDVDKLLSPKLCLLVGEISVTRAWAVVVQLGLV